MAPLPIAPVGTLAPLQLVTPAQLGGPDITAEAGALSFGDLLKDKIGSVIELQQTANLHTQAVASGQSDDLTGATIAVEKASIATELVSGIRNKAVEAYQDVMRMQV